jgi:hypothetical protein
VERPPTGSVSGQEDESACSPVAEVIRTLTSRCGERPNATGMEVFGNKPEIAALIKRDIELYRKMVPIVGIKPE